MKLDLLFKNAVPLICGFLLYGVSFGQMRSSTSHRDPPVGALSSLEGIIVDAATGAPVPDKTVILELPASEKRQARTGKDGRYSFSQHFTGSCRISTPAENGYLRASKRIMCAAGQQLSNVDLRINKGAVIAGRVFNAARIPVVGATVHVRMEGYRDGRPQLLASYSRSTDDLGGFRFANLYPGSYIVNVTPRPLEFYQPMSVVPVAKVDPVIRDAITYYPNSLTAESAASIAVRPGEVWEQVDLVMLRADSVCVSTTLVPPAASAPKNWLGVTLWEAYPMSQSKVAIGRFRSSGLVEVCGITPGAYQLTATTRTSSGRTLFGLQPVLVSGSEAVRLPDTALQPLQPVAGRVVVAKETLANSDVGTRPPPAIEVSLEPKTRPRWGAESLTARSSASGGFLIPATMIDDYWVTISGLPDAYYVKAVYAAARNVYATGLHTASGELEVILGADGPSLSGAVTDDDNHAIADATVILVPAAGAANLAPNQILTAATDPNGRFRFTGMPPGDYALAAIVGVPRGQTTSPAAIEAARSSSTHVTLPPRVHKTITLLARDWPQF